MDLASTDILCAIELKIRSSLVDLFAFRTIEGLSLTRTMIVIALGDATDAATTAATADDDDAWLLWP